MDEELRNESMDIADEKCINDYRDSELSSFDIHWIKRINLESVSR